MMSSAVDFGTSSYCANCMVYTARPWLSERSVVEYPNISPSGTEAPMTRAPARSVMPPTGRDGTRDHR